MTREAVGGVLLALQQLGRHPARRRHQPGDGLLRRRLEAFGGGQRPGTGGEEVAQDQITLAGPVPRGRCVGHGRSPSRFRTAFMGLGP